MKEVRRMVLLLAAIMGCATAPPRDVGDLLSEARANEVAAFGKNRTQRLRVTGVVAATGLDQYLSAVARTNGLGYIEATQQAVTYPYLLLSGQSGSPYDMVRCYFASASAEEVGRVTRGTRLVVRGTFDQYFHQPPVLTLVLNSCDIE